MPCTRTRTAPRRGRRPKIRTYENGAALAVWDSASPPTANEADPPCDRAPPPNSSADDSHSQASSATDSGTGAAAPATAAPAAEDQAEAEALFALVFDGSPWEASPRLIGAFYSTFSHFLLGPTLAGPLRLAAQRAFFSAPGLLRHVYPAIEAAMSRARELSGTGNGTISGTQVAELAGDSVTVGRGARALETLRTVEVKDCDAALGMLTLGQVLAAFDLLLGERGVVLILRHALVAAGPWYQELALDSTLDSLTVSTVFWGLVCALARNEMPTIKPRVRGDCAVDRLAGLCTSLMPLLSELAVAVADIRASREMKCQYPDMAALRRIEDNIANWALSVPQDFESTYHGEEKVRMQAQASMYRSAALLVAHRAKHPLLSEDEAASRIVLDILKDYARHEDMLESSNKGRLRHVTFPLLVAAYELQDEATTSLQRLELMLIAPACRRSMLSFIERVWTVRATGVPTYLSELVRSEKASFAAVP